MKKFSKEWLALTDEGRALVWQKRREELFARGQANFARYGMEDPRFWEELSWKEIDEWINHKGG